MKQQDLKMYILVGKHLKDKSYEAVQACHAVAEYLRYNPQANGWRNGTMVLLKVENEDQLLEYYHLISSIDNEAKIFFEPDVNRYTTCAAVGGKKLNNVLKDLKLL